MAKRSTGRYVFLDLGKHFSAGKLIRSHANFIQLEVYRGKRCFRPGYSWETVNLVLPIDRGIAKALGRFTYPPYPTDMA